MRPRNSASNGRIKENAFEVVRRGKAFYLGNGKSLCRDDLKTELPDIKGAYVQGKLGSFLAIPEND